MEDPSIDVVMEQLRIWVVRLEHRAKKAEESARLRAALASAGRSLISYEASYGGGGGDSEVHKRLKREPRG